MEEAGVIPDEHSLDDPRVHRIWKKRLELLFGSLAPTGLILDAGCGPGTSGIVLAELGATRAYGTDTLTAWRFAGAAPLFTVTLPYDGQPASAGNGTMVALQAADAAQVRRLHALALRLGAANEGDPGPRGRALYAGYFRDPDGNKLNVHCTP